MVIWLTGLSGAGKSTIASTIVQELKAQGNATALLDGDDLRSGLNSDLGFAEADRKENVRRVGEVARLMSDAGLVVIVALISPFKAGRDKVRLSLPAGRFIEVFVSTPLYVAEARDSKGLYRLARAGKLPDFTGISSPYEVPDAPEVFIETEFLLPEQAARLILAAMHAAHGAAQWTAMPSASRSPCSPESREPPSDSLP